MLTSIVEYGAGSLVSTLGDVYSYGILLLELFTGKRPTDDVFKDGSNLHGLVAMALPGHVMEIVDPSLPLAERKHSKDEHESSEIEEKAILSSEFLQNASSRLKDCLVSVMRIGLLCSNASPMNRMPMNMVVNKMQEIRDAWVRF